MFCLLAMILREMLLLVACCVCVRLYQVELVIADYHSYDNTHQDRDAYEDHPD